MLNNILEYQVPIGQAAEILGVSERHARRLLNAYRRDGAAAWLMETGDANLTMPSWILRLPQ